MMYRDSSFRWQNNGSWKNRLRILGALCAVLLIAVVVLAVLSIRSGGYRSAAEEKIKSLMSNNVQSAISKVDAMNNFDASKNQETLAEVQQHVYLMEQINELHFSLDGARLADPEAFTVLKNEVKSLFETIRANKSPVQDGRARLRGYLVLLQNQLAAAQ